jgi:hypothetical protein
MHRIEFLEVSLSCKQLYPETPLAHGAFPNLLIHLPCMTPMARSKQKNQSITISM